MTLEFPTVLTPKMSVAAEIQVADDVQIQALEDNSINLGAQLTSKVDAINADGVEDVLTIIVDPTAPGIPPGLVITGRMLILSMVNTCSKPISMRVEILLALMV